MPRTIIDIPAAQLAEIDRHCRDLGISRAEGVRRALQDYLQRHDDDPADGFGAWCGATAQAPPQAGEAP